ncbi:Anoctamin-8 [Nymphon striatum]|nr:Anoctamin-8 [Nymphon striatum]
MLGLRSNDLLRINPSKLLSLSQQPLPTNVDCDVVITFPPNTSEGTLTWILARFRLRIPELKIHVHHHTHTGVYVFYVTQSFENFMLGAEELKFPKRLKEEYGGGLKEFILGEMDYFTGIEDQENFLTTQEKQCIILHRINSLYAVVGDELMDNKFIEGQSIIPKCKTVGIIDNVVALHEYKTIDKLKRSWVQAFFSYQPLDDICDYFGVKIAMYFAWLGHYTRALILPTIVGVLLWFFSGRNQMLDDLFFVLFGLFNVIWATLYLESWKRSCAEHAYHWGTLDKEDELIVYPRPLFTGHLEVSPVTSKLEPTYPTWKRNFLRYCVTVPVILMCLFIVFIVMFLIFELQVWWDHKVKTLQYPFWLTFFPKILLALAINFMDGIYNKIAHWLNDQENYRLDEAYENHLVTKVVVFQFVNSFLSLFYIAFYLQDMDKLRSQLAALLITRQVVGNVKESLIPFIKERMKLFKLSIAHKNAKKEENTSNVGVDYDKNCDLLTQAEAECARIPIWIYRFNICKEEYGEVEKDYLIKKYMGCSSSQWAAIEDDEKEDYFYHELAHELGDVGSISVGGFLLYFCSSMMELLKITWKCLFNLVMLPYFHLLSHSAGLCALLNNIIEIRSDAFKLCMIHQRPFGERVENIGTWQDAMEMMGIIAVISQLCFNWNHVILSLKFILAYAIPDVPQWVATEMAKVEFNRREAAKVDMRDMLVSTKKGFISSILYMNLDSNFSNIHPICLITEMKKEISSHHYSSDNNVIDAGGTDQKSYPSKFKFPSEKRSGSLVTPDTPPSLMSDPNEEECSSSTVHSKSRLSRLASFGRNKKVKFQQTRESL